MVIDVSEICSQICGFLKKYISPNHHTIKVICQNNWKYLQLILVSYNWSIYVQTSETYTFVNEQWTFKEIRKQNNFWILGNFYRMVRPQDFSFSAYNQCIKSTHILDRNDVDITISWVKCVCFGLFT